MTTPLDSFFGKDVFLYRHVCWLPSPQGFCQLFENHVSAFTRVGEEWRSRSLLDFKAGAQLRRRSLPNYHWPNTPACFCRAFLWPLSPSLIPGNHLTEVDLRSSWQSLLRSRSRFTICSFELVRIPAEINSMKLISLLCNYFCSHRCSNPILNRQLASRQCWHLRSEGSFHTSHACPDNILETNYFFTHRWDMLDLTPHTTCGIFYAFSLWDQDYLICCVWLKLYLGDKNVITGKLYSHV